MSAQINQFAGRLMTFSNLGDGDCVETSLLIEVSDFTDGEVEVAFNDRNERCYLRFPLADLIRHIACSMEKL